MILYSVLKILIKMHISLHYKQKILKQMNKGVHIVKENFTPKDQHSPVSFYYQLKDISIFKKHVKDFREEYSEKNEFEVHFEKKNFAPNNKYYKFIYSIS